MLSAFGAAWRAASAEAGKEVVLVREQCAEEVKAANMQFQDALQNIERLEAESEVDASKIEALNAKVAELESLLHKMETESAANKATVDQLLERLQRAEKEAAQAREEKDKAIKEAAELRGSNHQDIQRTPAAYVREARKQNDLVYVTTCASQVRQAYFSLMCSQ